MSTPKTYLNGSIKQGKIMRWPINNLIVYVAPMKFYSKQGEDAKFQQMVRNAFNTWQIATEGKLTFKFTNKLLESNINVDWKRVERTALGHCVYNWDNQGRLYGAEVSIGLTDGRIHQKYDNDTEIYHTILHEIGHAIGLGHSPYTEDIMYTPHQYGVSSLSKNDKHSAKWLYRLPAETSIKQLANKYNISTSSDIDAVIRHIESKNKPTSKETYSNISKNQRDLLQESSNIADLKKYNMMLQNISISPEIKNILNKRPN